MNYTLRQIQCFLALSEHLHFGRAATHANITQPALSRQILALENALNVQLVVRDSGDVHLTGAGRAFLAGCRQAQDVLEAARRRARLIDAGAEGVVRVGYTDFAISSSLPDLFAAYRREHPGVVLEPFQSSTADLVERLDNNQLDVVFGTGPIARTGLSAAPFLENRLIGILYAGHPLTAKSSLRMSDFDGQDLVLGMERFWGHFLVHLNTALGSAGIDCRVVERGFNSEGLFGLVAAQSGITIYPDCAFNYVRRGLVLLEIDDLAVTVPTQIAWRDAETSAVTERFVAYALDCATAPDETATP